MRTLTVPLLCGVLLSAQSLSAERGVAGNAAEGNAAEEKAIMTTLEAYATAIINRDVPTLDRIYHDDLSYNHSTGATQNKTEIMKAVPGGTFTTTKFSDARFQFYGQVAVVRVVTDLTYYPGGVRADRHLNQMFVMLKGAKGWQIVAKHTTRIAPAPASPPTARPSK